MFMTRSGVDLNGATESGGVSFLEGIAPSHLPFEHILADKQLEVMAVRIIGPSDGWSW